MFGIFYHSPTC